MIFNSSHMILMYEAMDTVNITWWGMTSLNPRHQWPRYWEHHCQPQPPWWSGNNYSDKWLGFTESVCVAHRSQYLSFFVIHSICYSKIRAKHNRQGLWFITFTRTLNDSYYATNANSMFYINSWISFFNTTFEFPIYL